MTSSARIRNNLYVLCSIHYLLMESVDTGARGTQKFGCLRTERISNTPKPYFLFICLSPIHRCIFAPFPHPPRWPCTATEGKNRIVRNYNLNHRIQRKAQTGAEGTTPPRATRNLRGTVAFNFSPRNLTQVTSAMKPG